MVEEIKAGASKFFDYASQSILGGVIVAAIYVGMYSSRIDANSAAIKEQSAKIEQMQFQLTSIAVIKAHIEEIRKDQDILLREIKEIKR